MTEARRIDVGFKGGQVLAVRADGAALDGLVAALQDDKSVRWHTLDTHDSSVLLDLSQVVYVERETGDQRVGF